MKTNYKGLTLNKMLAVVVFILMVTSIYFPFVAGGGIKQNLLLAYEDLGRTYAKIHWIVSIIFLLPQFINRPRLSSIGAVLYTLLTVFNTISIIYYTSRYIPNIFIGFWLLLISCVFAWVLVFLKPYQLPKNIQNKISEVLNKKV